MKKRVILLCCGIGVIALFSYAVYWAFFDMNSLPKGELIAEIASPNGEYTIKVYLINPALSTSAVRGELNYNSVKKHPKNIYWDAKEVKTDVVWLNDQIVMFNGHELNILHDTFDWRRSDVHE